MEIVGWAFWVIVLFFSLGGGIFVVKGLKDGLLCWQTIARVGCQWILLTWSFLMPEFNRLHLVWLFPLTYGVTLSATFVFAYRKWPTLAGTLVFYCVVLAFVSP